LNHSVIPLKRFGLLGILSIFMKDYFYNYFHSWKPLAQHLLT